MCQIYRIFADPIVIEGTTGDTEKIINIKDEPG